MRLLLKTTQQMMESNGQSAAKILNPELDTDNVHRLSLGRGVHLNYIDLEKAKDLKDSIFIYCLCDENLEIRYVGITKNLRTRLSAHKCVRHNENNWKVNWVKSVNKNISMIIIDVFNIKEFSVADDRETYFISELSKHCRLVNHDKLVFNRETEYRARGHHKNKKSINIFNKDCRIIKKFNSLKEAIAYLKISYSGLSCAIKRKALINELYYASFDDVYHPKKKYKSPLSKIVYQFTIEGLFVNKYSSVAEASRETLINRNSIKDCINGGQKSAGGFIFFNTNNFKKPTYRGKTWQKRSESFKTKI